MNKILLSPRETKLLRTLVQGELESLTELPAYCRLEKCYQSEFANARQLAERLGAGVSRFPKQLKASAKEAADARAKDEAYKAELLRTGLPRFMR
jgi:hypothetical protein